MARVYLPQSVLEASVERIAMLFDRFDAVCVSVSGGKDSHVLFELAHAEAQRRGRQLPVFFLDQEAEYQATIDVISDIMARPCVVPYWYQVSIRMTNATSYSQEFLHAWEPGAQWMRDKSPLAIHSIERPYPDRFHSFIQWFEGGWPANTCFLVGLRADESRNRAIIMTKWPGLPDVYWSKRGANGTTKAYPLYDWKVADVFHFLWANDVAYNRIYDFMYTHDDREIVERYRVSNLIHEKAFAPSLSTLQAFEPETYARLIARLEGVHTAAIYADSGLVYSNDQLPVGFISWGEYRDYLLLTLPNDHAERFASRFKSQPSNELTFRAQVRQLLVNDWENNLPVVAQRVARKKAWQRKWMEEL